MKCPRRAEIGDESVYKFPKKDRWIERNGDEFCSFCGSMRPERFLELAEQGVELVPTDKNYKVYVRSMRKFYFQHLSFEQMGTFVDMLNEDTLTIGHPGHFYTLPYFCAPIDDRH